MTDQEPTTITATEMQTKSGEIIRRVYDGEHFIVERHGYPMVAIVPVGEYRKQNNDRMEDAVENTSTRL